MIHTITHRLGTRNSGQSIRLPRGESLTISLQVRDSAGAVANLTGYHAALALDITPTTGGPSLTSIAGDATGIFDWHIHGITTAQWPDAMQYEIWLQLDSNPDDPDRIVGKSFISVLSVVDNPVPIRVYYGAAAAGLAGTATIEAALSHVDTESGGFEFTTAPANQKLYYAHPVAWGIASATYNGATFAELTPRVESLHDQHGDVIPYYLHESVALYTGA